MKVKELIENLEEFQKKIIEHQTLYNNSFPKYTGGMYPVKNKQELQEQSLWLNRWWGENQSIINQFRDKTTVQSPSTGDEWDYINSAIGLDEMAPTKTEYLKKLIAEIERIIGRLISMNSNQDDYSLSDNFKKVEQFSASNAWSEIKKEFDVNKRAFSKKIHFVKDKFKKNIIFRDIEHAYFFAQNGFYKPAVILAGGVIEELLRLYLKYQKISPSDNTFNEYIISCDRKGLFKKGISKLSDSLRDFRNIVHLEKEESSRYTISKATAKGAISSIFTISNDF